ncbi:MAG: hypothetical protein Q9186_004490 [Xanthomendoza sp. 1 TL-2023]
MIEGDLPAHLPLRRRPSLFPKVRSRSNKTPNDMERKIARPGVRGVGWLPDEEGKDVFVVGLDTPNTMVEGTAYQKSTRRKSRASFSGFSHAMSDLRAFPRRIASQRRKPLATLDNTFRNDIDYLHHNTPSPGKVSVEDFPAWEEEPHSPLKAPGWLRRCMSTTFRHRRQTLDTPSRPATALWYPPTLPETGTSGAAARAAAAAQNEIQDCLRKAKKERLERMVRGDAESGVGVGVDSRPGEIETSITRRDPFRELPNELFIHILSHLDAQSLVRSELVSRQWYSPASDPLVWKKIFYRDFRQALTIPENSSDFQAGQGLGNEQADQDWKQMWKVRKALHQRWTDSHAAAIYLEGHYDSVYCVQFDE